MATDKNCMAVVEILKHDMEDHLLLPRMVEENQVEGLIVMGEISKDYIHFMKEQTKLPIIFLDFYDKELSEDAVIADNFYGMYLLTEYLFERGYQKLAYVGSINDDILDKEEVALALLEELWEKYPQRLTERYSITGGTPLEMYETLCTRRGFILRGGDFDYTRGALALLDDFRKGRLGKVCLDSSEDLCAAGLI